MSRRWTNLLVALFATVAVLLVVAPGVMAAEAGHPTFNWKKEGLKTLNLLIVLGVLGWILKDRLPAFFGDRRRKIDEAIEEAKAAKAEAEAKQAEYEAKIAQVEEEIAAIDAEGARRVEAMRAELAEAAEATAERVAHEAEERIAAEVDRARDELQREASLLAVELAEELIKERVDEEDQRRLFKSTMEKLEELP